MLVTQSCLFGGLESTKLLCPWNSPGKNTGVGFHFLLLLKEILVLILISGADAKKMIGCYQESFIESQIKQENHGKWLEAKAVCQEINSVSF